MYKAIFVHPAGFLLGLVLKIHSYHLLVKCKVSSIFCIKTVAKCGTSSSVSISMEHVLSYFQESEFCFRSLEKALVYFYQNN